MTTYSITKKFIKQVFGTYEETTISAEIEAPTEREALQIFKTGENKQ